ncbi:MAG TPA: DUF2550 family protein [Dermatophilaceae bacterium]|nr:DUF2550 family protein [Dermatophilaceae bacterium]
MPGPLLTAEFVVGACLLILLAFLAVTFVRRRTIIRSGDVTLCGMRTEPGARWRLGLLRLSAETLDWFTLFGLTPRAHSRWMRTTLELGLGAHMSQADVQHPLLGPAVSVPFSAVEEALGPVSAELAIPMDRYTAVRSWVEAAPPGTRPVG